MGKSVSAFLEDSGKWLEKNANAGLNLKAAVASLSAAMDAIEEVELQKAKLNEVSEAKKTAIKSLEDWMRTAKLEKKLKQKEARLQTKLAALATAGK